VCFRLVYSSSLRRQCRQLLFYHRALLFLDFSICFLSLMRSETIVPVPFSAKKGIDRRAPRYSFPDSALPSSFPFYFVAVLPLAWHTLAVERISPRRFEGVIFFGSSSCASLHAFFGATDLSSHNWLADHSSPSCVPILLGHGS